ncbi:MAG: radical SAM protein [Desulfobacterales bacterium]|nr:radical SAM protein [Desulfobacterales bacterium]
MEKTEPAYIRTHASGALSEKIRDSRQILENCELCPRRCGVNRLAGETGLCKTPEEAQVSSFNAHFGEEAPLVGRNGSGTIFFTHCNLMCCFCQNFDISHEGWGSRVNDEELAAIMIALQDEGCHNINLVTPSHVVPQFLSALEKAIAAGLTLPIVYNSGGYDRVETLRLLEGVVDIYMPDFKFWNSAIAEAACDAPDYPDAAKAAIREMHRQTGDLKTDEHGIARSGLLVRHLVLPQDLAGSRPIMRFLHDNVSPDTYVNIMPQYRPCGNVHQAKGLDRRITSAEFQAAREAAREEGIIRLDRIR